MSSENGEYFLSRAVEECTLAANAADPIEMQIRLHFAVNYMELANDADPAGLRSEWDFLQTGEGFQ